MSSSPTSGPQGQRVGARGGEAGAGATADRGDLRGDQPKPNLNSDQLILSPNWVQVIDLIGMVAAQSKCVVLNNMVIARMVLDESGHYWMLIARVRPREAH